MRGRAGLAVALLIALALAVVFAASATANVGFDTPDAGLIGLDRVSIVPTSGGVDSFDSSLGPYGPSNHGTAALVASNGLVSIGEPPFAGDVVSTQGSVRLTTSAAVVTGNVTAGGTVSNPGHIEGTVTESSPSPAISVPSVAACGAPYSAHTGISGRDFVYSQRTGNLTVFSHGTVRLANGVYCFRNVLLSTDTRLKVTGPVTITLNGTLVAPTAKIINAADVPADLRIYSSYSGAGGVAIEGGLHAYLTILAPRTDVTIVRGSFFGRIVAQTLKVRGAAAIHVDVH